MRRAIGVLCCGLALAAAACSSTNDRPDTDTTTTSVGDAADTTTTTGGGPFDGATTTTAAPGEGAEPTDAPAEAPTTPTGSGSAAPTSPIPAERPSDVADALDGQCTDYADVGAALQQPGTTAEGTCLFGGEVVNVYLFADVAAQQAFVDEGAFFDCGFIVAFGGGGATWFVAGEGWIARPGTERVARDLAAALDGELATYTCEA